VASCIKKIQSVSIITFIHFIQKVLTDKTGLEIDENKIHINISGANKSLGMVNVRMRHKREPYCLRRL
jgi:hypothetical protein